MNLYISQAKPNPTGKDKFGNIIPKKQLAGEWVDFKNISSSRLSLDSTSLYHRAYTDRHPEGEWDKIMQFNGNISPGETVRVHSGGEIPLSEMYHEDANGADYHLFTGEGYKWNNDKSDTAGLWDRNTERWIDRATYNAYPTEGKILKRQGELLV